MGILTDASGFQIRPKFANGFFFVVTSLDETFSAEEILNLYRLRWQVEMLFKRYKSILGMGSMPVRNPGSGMAWLSCKMLIALIIENDFRKLFFPLYTICSEVSGGR